jgi:hypothetical protein
MAAPTSAASDLWTARSPASERAACSRARRRPPRRDWREALGSFASSLAAPFPGGWSVPGWFTELPQEPCAGSAVPPIELAPAAAPQDRSVLQAWQYSGTRTYRRGRRPSPARRLRRSAARIDWSGRSPRSCLAAPALHRWRATSRAGSGIFSIFTLSVLRLAGAEDLQLGRRSRLETLLQQEFLRSGTTSRRTEPHRAAVKSTWSW